MPGYYQLTPDVDLIAAAWHAGEGRALCRWLCLKYVLRAGRKEGEPVLKDLDKAMDVLQRWREYEESQP